MTDRMPASLADLAPDHQTALPTRAHVRRLRTYYRSAGWPCHDNLEIELLNFGWVVRLQASADSGESSSERIEVTEAGLRVLGSALTRNRKAFDAHEDLVDRIARYEAVSGRLVYRGLMLRGRVESGWKLCRPDLYSIRYSSIAAYTEPVIHEVKVRRADLFSDFRNGDKRAAYQALSSAFFYVLPEGLAKLDEIPEECGVLFAGQSGFTLARGSVRRAVEPNHAVWMALARRAAEPAEVDEDQAWLGDSRMHEMLRV